MRGKAHATELRTYLMGLHEQGRPLVELSAEYRIPIRTLNRWWNRYRQEGLSGLKPRSRRPHRSPSRITAAVEQRVLTLRAKKRFGPTRLAMESDISAVSAYRILLRHGQNQLERPRKRSFIRYEKSRPGELLHLDLKYLPDLDNPRQEYQYVAVDDYSREAVAQIRAERSSQDATRFLELILKTLPYPIESVLTDNDLIFTMRFAYYSQRLTRFQQACRSLGIQHRLVQPYSPQSNGKVERLIRTIDDECYAVHHPRTCRHRVRILDRWLWHYNYERPHLSLKGLTPIQRRQAYFAQLQTGHMS